MMRVAQNLPRNSTGATRILLNNGADPNLQDVRVSQFDCVIIPISENYPVQASNMTPLMLAAARQQLAIVEEILMAENLIQANLSLRNLVSLWICDF